jgi:hypothetical protein
VTRFLLSGAAAAALLAALGGCEMFKHNEEALAVVTARVIGMPAGDFFDRYGRASVRREIADGGSVYDWMSDLGFAAPGPERDDDHVCKMRLTADKRGRISEVGIQFDGPGLKSTSRCRDIFAAK